MEEEGAALSSDRRIWKHRDGSQGSLLLSLKAYGVLYDAGRPLTPEELADQMRPRLVPTEIGYLEAWHLRRKQQTLRSVTKKRGVSAEIDGSALTTTVDRALAIWLVQVFCKRVRQGHTLIRDSEGRYAPGPSSPRIQTLDGQLLPYTPLVRQALNQADRDNGRAHLALMEWTKALRAPEFATTEARAQLLLFLARRFFVEKKPLDERHLVKQFWDLLQLADSPGVKRAVLERVFQDFLALL